MTKEIGSFIEFDFNNNRPYHYHFNSSLDETCLNTGRASIYYAVLQYNVNDVYLPFYMCPSVSVFLQKKGIRVLGYFLNEELEPKIDYNHAESAIVLPNYFGIKSFERISTISIKFTNVIVDNSQAFYSKPLNSAFSIYSPRKFFGVPDGGIVYGKINKLYNFPKDESSYTSQFLFERHEVGCQNSYHNRTINEKRLDEADILEMSKLSEKILLQLDYERIKHKRIANFLYAHQLLGIYNDFDVMKFFDSTCVPMVYPLLIFNETLMNVLKEKQIYTGRWWAHVIKNNMISEQMVEFKMSKFMLPLPIDQRYDFEDINFYVNEIKANLGNEV